MDLLKNTKQAKLSCLKKNYKDCHKIPIMLPKAVPVVEESYNPDRTRLSLEFTKKQAIKTSDKKQAIKTSDKTLEKQEIVREYLRQNGLSKMSDIAKHISLSPARTRAIISDMPDIVIEGTNTNRKYRLINEVDEGRI